MKILDINNLVSERVKIKPITNIEWEKIKDEICFRKIDKPTARDIRPGTAVIIADNELYCVYIAFDVMSLTPHFYNNIYEQDRKPGSIVLIRYNSNTRCYFSYWKFDDFITTFPVHDNFDEVMIAEVYITDINTNNITDAKSLKKEYDSICEKIANTDNHYHENTKNR